MPEYKLVFMPEHIDVDGYRHRSREEPIDVVKTTALINELAASGWRPISVVPGTNAQTYSGLYITLVRD